MAIINFNATEIEPTTKYDAIPAGIYEVLIIESIMKPTKAGTGYYLEIVLEVIYGEFKGRRIWHRINLENPNPKAVEIGKRELSAICHAVGILKPRDSSELHNLPLSVSVRCVKESENSEAVNEVKNFSAPTRDVPSAAPIRKSQNSPWGTK